MTTSSCTPTIARHIIKTDGRTDGRTTVKSSNHLATNDNSSLQVLSPLAAAISFVLKSTNAKCRDSHKLYPLVCREPPNSLNAEYREPCFNAKYLEAHKNHTSALPHRHRYEYIHMYIYLSISLSIYIYTYVCVCIYTYV